MGYELRREVRDAIPPGAISSAERLLVLEIADQCNDTTRVGWPGAELLAELTDLAPRSVQETLARIGRKWIELRVPLGKDRYGRPYYSHAGKRTTFRFPPLQPWKGAMDPGALGATDPGASGQEGATDPGRRCDGSVPKVRQNRGPSPHVPSGNSSSSARSRVEQLVAEAGAEDDEIPIVIEKIRTEHHPDNLGAYIAALARNGDLADVVAAARAERVKGDWSTERAAFLADIAEQPPCIHGQAGGAYPKPSGIHAGWLACNQCRLIAGWKPRQESA